MISSWDIFHVNLIMAAASEIPLHHLLQSASDNRFSLSSLHLFYKSLSFEYFVSQGVHHVDSEIPSVDLTEQ